MAKESPSFQANETTSSRLLPCWCITSHLPAEKREFFCPTVAKCLHTGIIICWDSLWNATVKGLVFNVPEEPVKTNCCHIVILI